jgi:phosphoadenosine phosphosulfate reductase
MTHETAETLAIKNPEEIIRWADAKFQDKLVMTSSFGRYSSAMLHLTTQIIPKIPVIFIDTGYLSSETYIFVDELTKRLNLNLHIYSADRTPAMQEAIDGKRWENEETNDFEQFKREVKINPLERALKELNAYAWLSGIMKNEIEERKNLKIIMHQRGIWKIHPIFSWTESDLLSYMSEHDLPINNCYFDYCKGKEQNKECGIHFEDGAGI